MLKQLQHDMTVRFWSFCHPEPGPELESGSIDLAISCLGIRIQVLKPRPYTGGVLYFLPWIFRNQTFATTAFLLLILGTLAAGAAVGTGLYGEEGVMVSRSIREHVLEAHEELMLVTLGLSIVFTVWALIARPFPRKKRYLFFFLLRVLLGIMTVGADYGARMVYDYNAGGNAFSQPIEFTR